MINNSLELHVVSFGFEREVMFSEIHLWFLNTYLNDINNIVDGWKITNFFEPNHYIV